MHLPERQPGATLGDRLLPWGCSLKVFGDWGERWGIANWRVETGGLGAGVNGLATFLRIL